MPKFIKRGFCLQENGAHVRGCGSFFGQGGKNQVATQGALPCISSAGVFSKLFGRITSSKSMLKKYAYRLGRHISLEWLLGTLRKKHRSSLGAFIMSVILKAQFQSRAKHRSPVREAGSCRFRISVSVILPVSICHPQGAPCRASQLPRHAGVCLCASQLS